MSIPSDFMLYKEALAASGYTVIKTEELEKLRLTLAEQGKTIAKAKRLIIAAVKAYYMSTLMFWNDIRDAKIWLSDQESEE